MLKIPRPDLAAGALCVVCVVGIVLLSALKLPVPDVLTFLAMGALGIGGGTALNAPSRSTASTPTEPAAATAPAPAAAADPSATGVFRVATHAP